MRVWIIIDGEKSGPFDIAHVARRIEEGELNASHYGWSEGMKEWISLAEMPQFIESFARRSNVPLPPPIPDLVVNPYLPPANLQGAVVGARVPISLLIRRFFARWFDWMLWSGIYLCTAIAIGMDVKALVMNYWFTYAMMIVWVILESAMMHLWRTTPGKFLLGIRVQSAAGGSLSLGKSFLRTVRVYLMGMGMIHPLLLPICHGFSFWFVRKYGAALWDGSLGQRVECKALSAWRWVAFVLILFTIMQVTGIMLEPVSREMLKDFYAQYPQWAPSVE
jgi:uncharacterized RDD family membrane protein YckC